MGDHLAVLAHFRLEYHGSRSRIGWSSYQIRVFGLFHRRLFNKGPLGK